MKFKLYALKSKLPKGVSAGTAKPVGPEPVKLALRVGAIVRVDVYALSYDPVEAVPVALCQMMLTRFFVLSFGDAVTPSRVTGA